MVVTISGSQQALLDRGDIAPIYLVDIRSKSGSLSFCSGNAIQYAGTLYQPYVNAVGTVRVGANFPDNSTTSKEVPIEFENAPIELNGTNYDHLSQTFDVFDWELADVNVKTLLTASGETTVTEDVAIPLVTSGVGGTPSEITREKFVYSVAPRNIKLNDSIPARAVVQEEFPEADRDVLNGRTYLPIVVGSGVRIVAPATGAGGTTTVTEQVDSGFILKVADTTGFEDGDQIVVGGFVNDVFSISTINEADNEFGLNQEIANNLGETIEVGTVVRENKSFYDYAIANHECGSIRVVYTTPRDSTNTVIVDSSLYSKSEVDDDRAIAGKRTDVRITELVPFGSGGVAQQPVHSVPGGDHKHNVSASQEVTTNHYAGSTSPGGSSAANDGNEDTFYALTNGNTLTFGSHAAINGTFESQRYFAIVTNGVDDGDWQMRRSSNTFLTVTVAHAQGEFRSAEDANGTEQSDWSILNNESSGQIDVHEGWKEVTMSPSVSEDQIDLSDTSRDTDVKVSGADVEVGERVEVIVDGPVTPDGSGRWGPVGETGVPIERPDAVMRWFLEVVLGEPGIIDEDAYAEAATQFEAHGIKLRFALFKPTKLDQLFDWIANNSQAIHFWGRKGHVVRFLEDKDSLVDPEAILVEDQAGVTSVDFRNTFAATDIRNELTAYFDRDWTQGKNKDEAYQDSVVGLDLDSQVVYGRRTGDIDGALGGNALYLDMLTTLSGAQATAEKVVGNWSTPKKHITASTDWTQLNLEPGDPIRVDSDLFLGDVTARVLEHSIDSRLFCRIQAREVSNSIGHHYRSGDFSQMQTLGDQPANLGNAWTLVYHFWALTDFTSGGPLLVFNKQTVSPSTTANRIRVFWFPITTGTPRLFIELRDANGTNLKQWEWNSVFHQLAPDWYQLVIRWDGTDIDVWVDPIGELGSAQPVSTKLNDDSITQADVDGTMTITPGGHMRVYQLGLWNTALTQAELEAIDAKTNRDFREESGDYTSTASLQHYWRFCLDRDDPGRDFSTVTATGIDLNGNSSVDASAARIAFPVV